MTEPIVITPEASVYAVVHDIASFLGLADDDSKRTAEQAVRVVYGLLHGQVRGRVPLPLPPDLAAVLRAAGTRYACLLLKMLRTGPQDPVEAYALELPAFTGWTFPELTVLARYRQRTG